MSGNRVRFRSGDSSPGSGSTRSHRSRDSVGQDVEDQRYNVQALQEALAQTVNELDHYKLKARQLDAEAQNSRKELLEVEASRRGLFEANENLKGQLQDANDTNKNIKNDNKDLVAKLVAARQDNARLVQDLDRAIASLRAYESQYAPPRPEMTTAIPSSGPAPGEPSKPRRGNSVRDKGSSTSTSSSDKNRLSQRFERTGETTSDSSGPSSQARPQRRRRDSYVEPWGPKDSRSVPPLASPVSAPVNRHYDHVATSSQRPAVFAQTQEPTYSNVPRTAGVPAMQRGFVETFASSGYTHGPASPAATRPAEDGNYHQWPLPDRKKK